MYYYHTILIFIIKKSSTHLIASKNLKPNLIYLFKNILYQYYIIKIFNL